MGSSENGDRVQRGWLAKLIELAVLAVPAVPAVPAVLAKLSKPAVLDVRCAG